MVVPTWNSKKILDKQLSIKNFCQKLLVIIFLAILMIGKNEEFDRRVIRNRKYIPLVTFYF